MTPTETSVFTAWEQSSRRRFRRWFVDMPSILHISSQRHECVIRDLSPTSAGIRLNEAREIPIGTEAALDLGGFGNVPAEVRSSDTFHIGLMFLHAEGPARELAHHRVTLLPARRVIRRRTKLEASLVLGTSTYPGSVADISRIGGCVLLDRVTPIRIGDEVVLRQEDLGDVAASVRWVADLRVGLMFLQVITSDTTVAPVSTEPIVNASADSVSAENDFLPSLKLGIEAHIREQVQRQDRGDRFSDLNQLVNTEIDNEQAKLEQLARRFEQEGDLESGRQVRKLIDDWLVALGQELKTE